MSVRVEQNFKVHRLLVNGLINIVIFAIGLYGLYSFHQEKYMTWLIGGLVVFYITEIIAARAYQRNTHLEMGRDLTTLYLGRLYYREVKIPNDKIYAIVQSQTVFQRLFKTISVSVQTTAGEHTIDGVTEGTADILMQRLLDNK